MSTRTVNVFIIYSLRSRCSCVLVAVRFVCLLADVFIVAVRLRCLLAQVLMFLRRTRPLVYIFSCSEVQVYILLMFFMDARSPDVDLGDVFIVVVEF